MTTKYVCDRCGKEKQHGDLFEIRLFTRDDCHSIPSGLMFGLQGEYCEECSKVLQRILQSKENKETKGDKQ